MPFVPIIPIAIIIGVILIVSFVITTGYLKAPPDQAYIISGFRRKVVIGKATVKIPLLERLDKLPLKLISVDVKTSSAVPTADYINISVDAVVNVKISSEQSRLKLAAENFLNQSTEYIGSVAREVLEGNMREIVGKMRLEEMVSDRQKFAELVRENADPDLAAMGLEIVSFNVQNFNDNNGVIDDLGIDNISQIKKKAAIAKAQADKEIEVARAQADKEANDARVKADKDIAERRNELALREFELRQMEQNAKAVSDAAYDIQKQEQRRTIEVKSADANIAAQERAVELKRREAEVMEQSLDAEVRKKAEAERFKRQQEADAALYQRQKDAEAQKFELERQAEAQKTMADAQMYTKQQEAAGITAVGTAEAEAIRAKGLAEAEAMRKKADAYKEYGTAAYMEMIVGALPEIAKQIAEPLRQIDKITIFGGDSCSGVDAVSGNVPAVMAKTFETVKAATGIDIAEVVRAETYDAKVTRNLNVHGLHDAPSTTPAVDADVAPQTSFDID